MLANLNSLSIERGRASCPVEVLEDRRGFASDPVEVLEQGERHFPFVAIGAQRQARRRGAAAGNRDGNSNI